jgi:flagella basal body P-ring formation protein FlgA
MLLTVLLSLTLSHALASSSMIAVREVTVLTETKERIRLSDIATFENVLPEYHKNLSQIVISDAPKDNEKRIFTRYAISELLRGPLHLNPVRITIPEKVQVLARFNPLNPDRLRQNLIDFYQPKSASELKFDDLRLNEQFKATVTDVKIVFKSEVPQGPFSLPVEVQSSGGSKTLWLSGTVKHFGSVPVLRRAVQAGQKAVPQDVRMEKKDVTFANDVAADEKDLLTAQYGRTMNAGTIVWRSSLMRQRALQAGEPVKLILGSSDWQVSVSGVAQQAGYIGDTVRVVNPATQKTMTGMVVDKGVVRVQ